MWLLCRTSFSRRGAAPSCTISYSRTWTLRWWGIRETCRIMTLRLRGNIWVIWLNAIKRTWKDSGSWKSPNIHLSDKSMRITWKIKNSKILKTVISALIKRLTRIISTFRSLFTTLSKRITKKSNSGSFIWKCSSRSRPRLKKRFATRRRSRVKISLLTFSIQSSCHIRKKPR